MIEDNIKGSKENLVTNGKLCVNFANLLKVENLQTAFMKIKEISLDESLNILIEKIKINNTIKKHYFIKVVEI